jgi:uncharacterized protein
MKFLVLLAILLVAYMIWRHGRVERKTQAPPPSKPVGAPQDMVQCRVCSVHLPRGEAVTGADGLPYCSQEHRLSAGQ